MNQIPYVSVIVPMYNAEKYIAELLESVLAQTLKNFEIIIVDDCSTDKSFEIVESYAPKFNGRLQLLRLKKNSGGPSIPRNKGLEMLRGKYILFADNDDALIDTALEELFIAAEKFNVDVVHCERYIPFEDVGKENNFNVDDKRVCSFMTDNLAERANIWMDFKFGVMPWLSFSSRKFLIESGIKFRELRREDVFWTLEVLFSAKKILRYEQPCYIHRTRENSLGHSGNTTLDKYLGYWMDRTVNGLKQLEEFLMKIDFFANNPAYRYAILNHWAMGDIQQAMRICNTLPPFIIKEVFQQAFAKDLGDKDTLVSYLFANSIVLTQNLTHANQKIRELTAPPRLILENLCA